MTMSEETNETTNPNVPQVLAILACCYGGEQSHTDRTRYEFKSTRQAGQVLEKLIEKEIEIHGHIFVWDAGGQIVSILSDLSRGQIRDLLKGATRNGSRTPVAITAYQDWVSFSIG